MNGTPVTNIRNFVIAGHSGSGQTALTDALAFKLGLNDRLGSTANGSSVSDFTDEEKARKISIFSATFNAAYKTPDGREFTLYFTDTPGYRDFYGQMRAACRAADAGVLTVDAAGLVQVGTRRAWDSFKQTDITSRMVAVTGLDKPNTDYLAVLESLKAAFGAAVVPVGFPTADGKDVVSVFDEAAVPAAFADAAAEARQALGERAAEADDALAEKFLMEEPLTQEEIDAGLEKAAVAGAFVPVVPVCPITGAGVDFFLQAVVRFLANPLQKQRRDADGQPIDPDPSAPFFGLVWRAVSDNFMGQLNYVRVLAGTLRAPAEVDNPASGRESVGQLLAPCGKKYVPVDSVSTGDLVAIAKLKATKVSDTLCAVGTSRRARPVQFPSPVQFAAVNAVTQADDDKLGPALKRLLEQDQTLSVERNDETHETILKGLGDVHLDAAVHLLKQMSNVNVTLSTPKLAYREAITGRADGHYKHKKQSGGRGQYGEVYMHVEPLAEGETEWFFDETVGGSIPGNYMPAIEKGCLEKMQHGTIAGYPVVGVKVRVYDGSYHEVDSSELAFKLAAGGALDEGLAAAKPVLLEPIVKLTVTTPEAYMGAVTGDLSHRRGRIISYDSEGDMQVIVAEVPQAEIMRYSAEIRSLTGGEASYELAFERYDRVPPNLVDKIVAASPHRKTEQA